MRVAELWRYPVRSVGGEPVMTADVGPLGVPFDRIFDVFDERDERTWAGSVPGLMRVTAVMVDDAVAELVLPDGVRVRTDAEDVDLRLSDAVGGKVRLAPHRPVNLDKALHVMTRTSLQTLGDALPDSVVDSSRFRPNLVLDDVLGGGYPEHGWIGRRLAIGSLRLRFTGGCDRCVLITKQTPTVPHDRSVLRWVARELGNTLGVYASVEAAGTVEVGSTADWLD